MKMLHSALRRVLPLALVAAVAGCAHANLAATPTNQTATSGSIMANGVERKLGFDWASYEQDYAPTAHPVHLARPASLPASADLRAGCAPVYDQGQLGSCTAFSTAKGLREFLQRAENQRVTPLSGLYEYYETRASVPLIGWILVKRDSGGTVSGAVSVLSKEGAAPESDWPYDITQFTVKPPAQAYSDAAEFKLKDTKQLAGLDDVKTSIAAGRPVSFGFKVYQSFKTIGPDGLMPIPAASEQLLGGHAILAVGYDDARQVLIIRNSWSAKWGDHGYFYMPYAVATNTAIATDFWTAN